MDTYEYTARLNRYLKERKIFLEIKNDPVRREKVVKYGVISCVLAAVGFVVSFLSFLGGTALVNAVGISSLVSWLFIPLYVLAFVLPPYCLADGLINAVRQIRLKRKFGGVLGAVLNPVSFAAAYYLLLSGLGA